MKKYIKTKTTIFEVVGENELVYKVKAKGNPNNIYTKSKCQGDILKEDMYLDNLINRYIAVGPRHKKIISKYQFQKMHLSEIKSGIEAGIRYFGCIWTLDEVGAPTLKAVTEVNKEGELELL